jgi:imidazolonepropionase
MRADLIVVHAEQLLTMADSRGADPTGAPASGPFAGADQARIGMIEDGAIACHDGMIVAIGPTEEVLAQVQEDPDVVTIDARGKIVSPGLVDAHTHLVFAGTREREFELRARGATYAEIHAAGGGIHSTVRATREASKAELIDLAMGRLQTMLEHGATTVEAKSGYGLDLDTEVKQLEVLMELSRRHPVDVVPTFMGAHAVPRDTDPETFVTWLVEEAIPKIAIRGLARFCDVFCEKGVFTPEQTERILKAAQANGLGAKLHADELVDTGGAALAAKLGAVSADHLHCANLDGLAAMAEAGVVAVLLPGTGVFLGMREHAPARQMIEAGVPVAVATDFNPGSCFSESLPLMMSLAVTQLKLTPQEAWVAVTRNAAHAVGRSHRVGSLEVGKQADLVLWNAPDFRVVPYRMGINLVDTVVKLGRVVHRREPRPEPLRV